MKRNVLVASAALILAGCGGASSPSIGGKDGAQLADPSPQFTCNSSITSKNVSYAFSAGCEGCGITNANFAADDKPSSFALMNFTLPAGESASIRATAAPGSVYQAGTHPGVMASFPDGQTSDGVVINFYIRSYLGGVLQEEKSTLVPTSIRTGGADPTKTFFYMDTTKPYDAVEFVAQTQSGTAGYTAQFFQTCWNDDLAR